MSGSTAELAESACIVWPSRRTGTARRNRRRARGARGKAEAGRPRLRVDGDRSVPSQHDRGRTCRTAANVRPQTALQPRQSAQTPRQLVDIHSSQADPPIVEAVCRVIPPAAAGQSWSRQASSGCAATIQECCAEQSRLTLVRLTAEHQLTASSETPRAAGEIHRLSGIHPDSDPARQRSRRP